MEIDLKRRIALLSLVLFQFLNVNTVISQWDTHLPKPTVQKDSLAMVAFYNASGWDWSEYYDKRVCKWPYIRVESFGDSSRVTEFFYKGSDFEEIEYNGELPSELGDLDSLGILMIQNPSGLTGTLPESLGKSSRLRILGITQANLTGAIPASLWNCRNLRVIMICNSQIGGSIDTSIYNLQYLNTLHLNDNNITELPDLSRLNAMHSLDVSNNYLLFDDLEPNVAIPEFIYAPQKIDTTGTPKDTVVFQGDKAILRFEMAGAYNQYQWMKGGMNIEGADSSVFTLDMIDIEDAGIYICKITNSVVPGLTFYSKPQTLVVHAQAGVLEARIPQHFYLNNNYPNPFNPLTTITYSLAEANDVHLMLYDILGRQVMILYQGRQLAGQYAMEWNGWDEEGRQMPSGIYVIELKAGDFCQKQKMMLLR